MAPNLTAEDLLAGAMLASRHVLAGVVDANTPVEAFQGSQVRQLVEVLYDMHDANLPVEPVAARRRAEALGYDIQAEWLTELRTAALEHPVVIESWRYYLDAVQETARKTRALKAAQSVIDKFRTDPTLDIQGELATALLQMQTPPREQKGGWIGDLLPPFLDDVVANWEERTQPVFIPSGIASLDTRLRGGFRPGELVVVGARPGMGKTVLGIQLANNAARAGKRVVIFSAEMTAAALLRRASAEFTNTPAPLIDRRGSTGHERLELQRGTYLDRVRREMMHLPIYIDDTSRPSVAYMMDKVQRLGDIDLVVFDYLGLANDGLAPNASTTDKASKVSNDLMMMAKEINAPVVALSQLNRAVEQQKPYIPTLGHLRDSGQVEANAHIVLLLYRRAYYVEQQMLDEDDEPDYLDIFVAKNREGMTGQVRTKFDGPTFSITDC